MSPSRSEPSSFRRQAASRWRWILALYLAALGGSSVALALRSHASTPLPHGVTSLRLPVVDGADRGPAEIDLAFRDVGTAAGSAPPVILLHGSPGRGATLGRLADALAASHRVIVPDLPGFGASSRELPDYSFKAHAAYVRDLLERLGVTRVHVVAFSMGGGVGLSLTDLDPSRVASLTLLSAIGVQEMELLGQYHVNHMIHGVQLAALWLASRGVPHFGVFGDALELPLPYARNFFDSDQRPLRAILANLDAPTLILHGRDDQLVPMEAAVEHARIVPQSELRLFDQSHFMVFTDPSHVAAAIGAFLEGVDHGGARRRPRAAATRLVEAARPFDVRIVPRARAVNAAVLGSLLAAVSWISGGVGPIAGGVLAAQGRAGGLLALAACALGAALGAGVRTRPRLHDAPHQAGVAAASAMLRVAIGAVGGFALLSLPFPEWAGAWTRVFAVTSALGGSVWLAEAGATVRGRRLLASSWLRLTRWEYWPPWVFYAPVAIYIGWLLVRYRGAMVFTAANPAIPASGVVGESKMAILRGLTAAGPRVARSALIEGGTPTGDKRQQAHAFLETAGGTPPVVLKPDVGQRGSGVVVARTHEALDAYLAESCVDTVIQEYVRGVEFGIFYCRLPSDPHGRILSITEKQLPAVVGDGRRSLESLILDDPRTIGMARFHLSQQTGRLHVIPEAGQVESLGDCGSHCRGAIFTDGRSRLTPALERSVDEVARGFDGFYFGRFDVRAPSVEGLMRGEFVVIELNGVTSEATHIYDARVGLLEAYRVLFEQWRLAFEIGAANIARGVEPASIRTLVRLLIEYRQAAKDHLRARPASPTSQGASMPT